MIKDVMPALRAEAGLRLNWMLILLAFMLAAYGLYLLLPNDQALALALEDGLFEYATAAFFLMTSVFSLLTFIRTRNYFFIALAIVFFVGAGEEISWGQRLLGIETPAELAARNKQQEINLHNLDIFHPQGDAGVKTGLAKLLTIDFLYNLFWLGWGIVIPATILVNIFPARIIIGMRMPIPSLPIGILFAVNFAAYIVIRNNLTVDSSNLFYMKLREVFEFVSASIFAAIGIILYQQAKSK